jgi:hypothetical protein
MLFGIVAGEYNLDGALTIRNVKKEESAVIPGL